jgi:glycosyltransferase involved in cell wall biosynthesis
MKTLTLVDGNLSRPDEALLREMERTDAHPRSTYFGDELCTDLLNNLYLAEAPAYRRVLYRRIPGPLAQVTEAFAVRKRYDAVISWTEKLGMPFAAALKATHTSMPHVGIFSWISKPRQARWLRWTHSHFDAVILMSSVQRNFAISHIGVPEAKVPLLRWPVDTKFWRPMKRDEVRLCAVGREMRDYQTLIESIRDTGIPIHIAANTVPGKQDPWQETLARLDQSSSLITVGKKNYSELRELYASSRFMVMPVLPTDTDNGSTSILEAMAMGKPVVCSRTAGQVDIIEEGKTGLYVPLQDPRAMRDAIEYLWKNPEVAQAMGRNALDYVQRNHTLEWWVASIKSIVTQAIDRRRSRTRGGR